MAATRAQELLVVSTYPEKPSDGPWAPLYPHLDAADVPELEDPTLDVPDDHDPAPAPNLHGQRAERRVRIQRGAQPSYQTESVTEAKPNGPDAVLYPEREQDGYGEEFGTALHVLLDQCVRMRNDESSITSAAVAAVLRQAGAEATPEQVRRADAMVGRFLDSSLWTELQAADLVYTEYPLAHEVTDASVPVVQRGVIDLTYRTGEGWVLVDYKSDRAREETLATLSDDHPYAQQIRTYAESWAAV
ncbi:MAG: ATP-dependent DNA helicase, partial [Bacteroidetes bacterium QH_10_64_19]